MILSLLCVSLMGMQAPAAKPKAEPAPLAEYFRAETERIARDPLKGISSAAEWKARRPELQRRFKGMLGLDPEPPRGPLDAKLHGTLDQPDFVVEKITYASSPGLIVTGNLYRPKKVEGRLPAILYVCGHSQNEKDGYVLGPKAHYQHHAAWYASNGYVCLVVDTLQLGELPGQHHGTHRAGRWWWHARGYTPAGVEAWNAVRGIDYLISRPDVDPERLGVTGRSGGGATSWWVAAIDDRIKAAVPVAGITDLTDHVIDGVVEGHCDCMYPVNTHRWDFGLVAALAAPKALLLENTDSDPIFPEDGVRRVYSVLEKVYAWEGATDRLGLVIGKGGHVDTPEIRHPSFAFMNKWLKGKESPIDEPDRKIAPESLRVLDPGAEPPSRNAAIDDEFVPAAASIPVPSNEGEWDRVGSSLRAAIEQQVLPGLVDLAAPAWSKVEERDVDGFDVRKAKLGTTAGIELPVWTISRRVQNGPKRAIVIICDDQAWNATWKVVTEALAGKGRPGAGNGSPGWQRARAEIFQGATVVVFPPTGVGPTAWATEKDTQIRRRFALLGQTLDGRRALDVVQLGRALPTLIDASLASSAEAVGEGASAHWLLMASIVDPAFRSIRLIEPAATIREAPAFLGLARIVDLGVLPALSRAERVRIETAIPAAWSWPLALQDRVHQTTVFEVVRRP
ncbi:MAG: prolyl oligopeptidase family serine peptidase [Isosphaeraceae bacterium]|nr:prolyl oligopeptidase family serine peptidase [Isosphaeraceae bacterium]